ncbi:MAG: hypothetical protein CVV44_03175 [Spirochaetae bacterium HGW-Spirochaetae-1]|jgi:SAM-dependent methyltransferase|nr:MAG: hypothetical protein CVV44_03175 [Spirochaetae bacterium HGW-Spirochaetae-1]
MKKKSWQSHYTKDKSRLTYPDENLVRMLRRYLNTQDDPQSLAALDMGCGSGRHCRLLAELGTGIVMGMDVSDNALRLTEELGIEYLIHGDNRQIPLKNNSLDIVVAWGSLHYNYKEELSHMTQEIYRILKPGGRLFATLRSDRDTYLKRGSHLGNNMWQTDLPDLQGTIVSFYSEDELKRHFTLFNELEYGISERSLMGDTGSIISHWIIHALK